jgi:hypothetical protein
MARRGSCCVIWQPEKLLMPFEHVQEIGSEQSQKIPFPPTTSRITAK